MKSIVSLLFLLCCLPAQVVHLSNGSPAPFVGWKRTTIDIAAPADAGKKGKDRYVVGRRLGAKALRAVDIWTDLDPGERKDLDLSTFTSEPFVRPPLPGNPLAWFGGPAALNGTPMGILSLEPDGAGYAVHLRARTGRMFNVDLWLTWYPDAPVIAQGEVVVCCSNVSIPDIRETMTTPLNLTFGDALVIPCGKAPGTPIIAAGTKFADGQARALPVFFVWLRHVTKASDWATIGSVATCGIGAVGISKLLPDGNPLYPQGFNPVQWGIQEIPDAIRVLHTWEASWGVAPNSTITGAQLDQTFVMGEAMLPNGAGAEWVSYLAGLTHAKRPCNHLELNGEFVDTLTHPNCVIWSGRPHDSPVVSPDQLNKTESINAENSEGGWYGPDHEHRFYNTAVAGYRYTGSHAIQWILESQGHLFLMSDTVPSIRPNWSTNRPWAARAVGWCGIFVVHLNNHLEDRQLASRVVSRYRKRWEEIYLPELVSRPGSIWDVRWNDPRIGEGPWWIPWQQSIGSYGIWLAGKELGIPEAQQAGKAAAEACVTHNWILTQQWGWRSTAGIPWTHAGKLPTAPYEPLPESFFTGTPWNGLVWDWSAVPFFFDLSWDIPALYVALVEDPANVKARTIWDIMWTKSGGHGSWYPPGSQLISK